MTQRIVYSLGVVIFIASMCASCSSPEPSKRPISGKVALHNVEWSTENLVVDIVSYGCTKNSDFKLHQYGPLDIEVVRVKRDYCRKRPSLMTIVLPWASLDQGTVESLKGNEQLNLRNRLVIFPSKNLIR